VTKSTKRKLKINTRHNLNGLLFASPYIIGLICFIAYPIGASFYYSFTDYSVVAPPEWVGIGNYTDLFLKDELFWISLWNTVLYTMMVVPFGIIIGVSLALLLNTKIKFIAVYRTIYFLPVLVPAVAGAILWMWVMNPQYGLMNYLLDRLFRIKGPGWYADMTWAKPTYVLLSLWGIGYAVVIYLAGLQDVPQELYESAEIDGATVWHKIRHITLPMITPAVLFNLIMGVIGAFQFFTPAYLMTQGLGGPANRALFYNLYLYRMAFLFLRMGNASAMAWILLIMVLIATLTLFKSSARWVYYRGELR